MKLAELLPVLRDLPRADKFRVLQFLTTDLAHEEGATLSPGGDYPVWSPFDATDAAATLSQYLHDKANRPH